ncbi:MAG: acetoacetate decarboxylase family protein [Armatimonadota bacterium]|nr:acetoacetate decarboxylase family protein [Armatimonadota bacterium]
MTEERAQLKVSEKVESTGHPVTPSPCHPVPPPPWHLTGTAVLLPCGWRSALSLIRYDDSPVGPYNELALGVLTRHGPSVIGMWVTSEASLIGGRANWGYPKQLANLRWEREGERVVFQANGRVWQVRPWGPVISLGLKLWTVQILNDQRVRVPLHVQGRARLAFQGRRWALFIEPFELDVLAPE